MPAEQEAQFDLYGCGSRCIIKLAELHQKPISKAAFIDCFAPKYSFWNTQCGMVAVSEIIDITRTLELARRAQTYRGRGKVRQLAKTNSIAGVLVLTERQQAPNGDCVENYHIRLLRGFEADKWLLWNPTQDGQDFDNVPTTDEQLEEQLAHFIVLQ
jgi:hypothetical protein